MYVNSLCNVLGFDLPSSAVRRGTLPRGSGAGRQKAERDGAAPSTSAQERPLRATRRQLNANVRDMFDDARPDLDQALPDRRELRAGKQARLRDGGAHAMHQPERGGAENERGIEALHLRPQPTRQ